MDVEDEWQSLWTAVFGEPPFIKAEAPVIARVLVGFLPAAPPYEPEPPPHGPAPAQSSEAFTYARRQAMGGGCVS